MHYEADAGALKVPRPGLGKEVESDFCSLFLFQHGQIILTLRMNSNRKFARSLEKLELLSTSELTRVLHQRKTLLSADFADGR